MLTTKLPLTVPPVPNRIVIVGRLSASNRWHEFPRTSLRRKQIHVSLNLKLPSTSKFMRSVGDNKLLTCESRTPSPPLTKIGLPVGMPVL